MSNFLCVLTDKINQLTNTINLMQNNTGLYADPSSETTLTGRIRALEENVINSDPTDSNISRMQVDAGLIVSNGRVQTTYSPIGDCVNKEIMLQNPDDLDIWEPVSGVFFEGLEGNIANLGTLDYEGWKATVSYIYATKITLEEYDFVDSIEELVKDLYTYTGTVYRIIITITPNLTDVVLKWSNNNDVLDFNTETITTEHIRYINEEEFNTSLFISGSANVKIEVRNRLG